MVPEAVPPAPEVGSAGAAVQDRSIEPVDGSSIVETNGSARQAEPAPDRARGRGRFSSLLARGEPADPLGATGMLAEVDSAAIADPAEVAAWTPGPPRPEPLKTNPDLGRDLLSEPEVEPAVTVGGVWDDDHVTKAPAPRETDGWADADPSLSGPTFAADISETREPSAQPGVNPSRIQPRPLGTFQDRAPADSGDVDPNSPEPTAFSEPFPSFHEPGSEAADDSASSPSAGESASAGPAAFSAPARAPGSFQPKPMGLFQRKAAEPTPESQPEAIELPAIETVELPSPDSITLPSIETVSLEPPESITLPAPEAAPPQTIRPNINMSAFQKAAKPAPAVSIFNTPAEGEAKPAPKPSAKSTSPTLTEIIVARTDSLRVALETTHSMIVPALGWLGGLLALNGVILLLLALLGMI
jgi:hypothetical protein